MTDRYEEFKKWCIKKKLELPVIMNPYFIAFELEQEEKQKEKEIKRIIRDSIINVPLAPVSNVCNGMYCGEELINTLYNELKERDLIK